VKPYEVTSGIYDESTLIGTLITAPPTTSLTYDDEYYYFADPSDTTPNTTGIYFVIVQAPSQMEPSPIIQPNSPSP